MDLSDLAGLFGDGGGDTIQDPGSDLLLDPSQITDATQNLDPSQFYMNNGFDSQNTIPGNGIDPSTIQKLFGGSQPGQNLADISKLLGNFSSGEKANRVVQGNFTQQYDNSMLQAQNARNTNESDALKKLHATNYLLNGGSHFKLPTSLSLGGTQHAVPDLGLSPAPASAAQQQGAATLQSQLLSRLMPGGSYTPQPLSSYATPGTSEQVGNFGALGAGAAGAVGNMFKGQ